MFCDWAKLQKVLKDNVIWIKIEINLITTGSYKIKAKYNIFYYQWMIVACGEIDRFWIAKFHKEHDCNLPRLK